MPLHYVIVFAALVASHIISTLVVTTGRRFEILLFVVLWFVNIAPQQLCNSFPSPPSPRFAVCGLGFVVCGLMFGVYGLLFGVCGLPI